MNRSLKHRLHRALWGLSLLVVFALAACDRRPLEVIVSDEVVVKLVSHWDQNYFPIYNEYPNGMTAIFWNEATGERKVVTTNANSTVITLKTGTYRMLLFSDTYSDYEPYLKFNDTHSYDDMAAHSTEYNTRNWDSGITYINYPDPIGAVTDRITISEDMLMQDTVLIPYEAYRDNGFKYAITDDPMVKHTIHEYPYPMTVTLFVKAKIKRRQLIQSLEASLSGLADGFYLSKVNRTSKSGTVKLHTWDRWKKVATGLPADSMGWICDSIDSFGLPYGKETKAERLEKDNVLSFYITLVNGDVIQLSYNVGKNITYLTPKGEEARIRYREDLYNLKLEIDLPEDIILPPVPDSRTGAGFDAKVDDWEDGGTIDMGGF